MQIASKNVFFHVFDAIFKALNVPKKTFLKLYTKKGTLQKMAFFGLFLPFSGHPENEWLILDTFLLGLEVLLAQYKRIISVRFHYVKSSLSLKP